jgi:hypothetical protein
MRVPVAPTSSPAFCFSPVEAFKYVHVVVRCGFNLHLIQMINYFEHLSIYLFVVNSFTFEFCYKKSVYILDAGTWSELFSINTCSKFMEDCVFTFLAVIFEE